MRNQVIKVPFSRKTRLLLFGLSIIITIAIGVYANIYNKDPNFKPIDVQISSQNYTNCDTDVHLASAYCDETITGTVAGTGKPMHYFASRVHPTNSISAGSTQQYWTVTGDVSNAYDLDLRSGQPLASGPASLAFGVSIAISVILLIFAFL